jgi:plasmid stabilization system protein ParE
VKRYRVIITPLAGENLREAHVWLEAENPVYAATWLNGIREKILEPPP